MTSEPPIPYEKAIGAFNDSERPRMDAFKVAVWLPMSTEVLMDDPAFAAAHPWLQSDRRAKPGAWPRFSIWPFRLRRGGRQ